MIFKPTKQLASSTSYYVKTTSVVAVKSPSGKALSGNFNTKTGTPGQFLIHAGTMATGGTLPAPVWSSVEDYACLGEGGIGVLPEITLYMNEDPFYEATFAQSFNMTVAWMLAQARSLKIVVRE